MTSIAKKSKYSVKDSVWDTVWKPVQDSVWDSIDQSIWWFVAERVRHSTDVSTQIFVHNKLQSYVFNH
jgi:hypothetical protein